jgi:hypothetical protein
MFSKKYLSCFLFLAAFLLVFLQAEPLTAQVPGILGMPSTTAGFKMPEVGTFVKYKFVDEKVQNETILKLSIVGKEKIEGKGDFFWYEVEQTEPKTGNVTIVKLLMSGNPKDFGSVQRMIFKSGKEPASELPQTFVNLMDQGAKEATGENKPKSKNLGTEKIETKMKTFECMHTQETSQNGQVTDSWTNVEVPMFGIVKRTGGSRTLVLLDHGTGAVTAVKEKPTLLEMPGQK